MRIGRLKRPTRPEKFKIPIIGRLNANKTFEMRVGDFSSLISRLNVKRTFQIFFFNAPRTFVWTFGHF